MNCARRINIILLTILCMTGSALGQFDSSKYKGNSFDGFTYSNLFLRGLNGAAIDSNKFHGGSFDGLTLYYILQTGLNGMFPDPVKFKGGRYDGFSNSNVSIGGLGGLIIDASKFKGGAFDGFSLFGAPQTGLNGLTVIADKYHGGSFDGFSHSLILSGGLGGLTVDASKYKGGRYDGSGFIGILQTGLNGEILSSAKYRGGSIDGFSVTGTYLIPLSGGNMKLKLTALIEGFYNSSTDRLIKDTVTVYLRISSSPYVFTDSADVVPDSLGNVNIEFQNAVSGNYFIVIKHRNSIETWSANGQQLNSGGTLNVYDFTVSQDKAYGNNMILKGTKYCIFSGDVNQDGVIDGADLALIDNDASNFTEGYVATDVNGDMLTDGADLSITDNNTSNFISVQKPNGAIDKLKIITGKKQLNGKSK